MAQLGWPAGYAFMIGVIELTCLVLYLIPRSSVLGAVLMMGLFGGAMSAFSVGGWVRFTHCRHTPRMRGIQYAAVPRFYH